MYRKLTTSFRLVSKYVTLNDPEPRISRLLASFRAFGSGAASSSELTPCYIEYVLRLTNKYNGRVLSTFAAHHAKHNGDGHIHFACSDYTLLARVF